MRLRSTHHCRAGLVLLTLAALLTPGAAQGNGNGNGNGNGGGGGGGGGKGDPPPPNADIVFEGVGKHWQPALFLLDSATGETGSLTGEARGAAWSPDGSELAYWRPTTNEIRIIAADGSRDRPVTATAPDAHEVDWSRTDPPNGRPMLLWSDDAGIHVVATDGSGKTLLKAGSEWEDPRWSPGGDRFVAGTFVNFGDQLFVFSLGVTNGALTIVDEYPITHGPDNPFGEDWTASTDYDWSNSGAWIVFTASYVPSYPDRDLWLIDPLDPTRYQRLTFTPESELWPTFDATDSRIFYVDDTSHRSKRYLEVIDVVVDPTPAVVLSHSDIRKPKARRN